ncbi:MAG: ABC transporter ATP-binding protein [Planctomycetota bacterium]|nr:ABC transporter ATP-binding protein [Planctomycetota bacterium]
MQAEGLTKSFSKGRVLIPVLRGVDFEVREGEFQAIVGSSGSGKSTLLHLLATLDQPDDGKIVFEGNRIDNLPPASRDILRNRYIGIVFQFYHLLPELNALENVLMPLMISQGFTRYMLSRRRNRRRAKELLEMVGLAHRLKHRPRELSGGEMQRVAIARSLIAEPRLLLADEPTGNLDRQSGGEIMEILRNLNRERQVTIMMVTHDASIAEQADRTIRLVEGRVQ